MLPLLDNAQTLNYEALSHHTPIHPCKTHYCAKTKNLAILAIGFQKKFHTHTHKTGTD